MRGFGMAETLRIANCPMTHFLNFCRMLASLIGQLVSYMVVSRKNRFRSKV